jgi:excisionase family DNA binding protein
MDQVAARLLTLEDVRNRSRISLATWRRWLREGRLPGEKLGKKLLIAEDDYIAFVAAHRIQRSVTPAAPGRRRHHEAD